jgi:predicted phage terminase large subunit-like protein
MLAYHGLEVQYLAFDELTSFTEKQYTYMLSRVRSANGIPVRVRAATNPGGIGHDWVFKRWAPWLNPKAEIRAAPAEVLHYCNTDDGEAWCPPAADALARVFIPAKLQDNPYLDGAYAQRLGGLDRVTRAQLRDGDWLIAPAAGAYYRRAWFPIIDIPPANPIAKVRRWDLASTADGGDWTIGARMALHKDRTVVIEDVVRIRARPQGVEQTILNTALLDGKTCHVSIPQDPGQAGKAQIESFTKLLAGYVVRSKPETGDKVTRQEPFSAQCEAGNVSIVRAPWNEPVLQCLEAFPDGPHDDDVDALAGAYAYLADRLPNLNYLKALENMAAELSGRGRG